MRKYCILGTDLRSKYLRKLFIKEKKEITDLEDADVVIAPIPFTKDNIKINGEIISISDIINRLENTKDILITGAMPKEIKKELIQKEIIFYDIMENDSMAIYNAIPTAEGAIACAIENTDFTLHSANILVLGFGRVGKVLAKKLSGLDVKLYCEARKESDLAIINAMGYIPVELENLDNYLGKMDIIFNTIPKLMLDKKRLDLVSDNALIIDLASSPGGVDFKYAKESGKKVEWTLAIPSKIAPYTAAIYIKNEIDKILV